MIPYTFRSNPSADPASAATYAAVPVSTQSEGEFTDYLTATSSGPIAVNWKNTGDNAIDVKIVAGNEPDLDEADRATVLAETEVAAGASLSYANSAIAIAYYQYYWFMQKDASGGSHGASQLLGRHARV